MGEPWWESNISAGPREAQAMVVMRVIVERQPVSRSGVLAGVCGVPSLMEHFRPRVDRAIEDLKGLGVIEYRRGKGWAVKGDGSVNYD